MPVYRLPRLSNPDALRAIAPAALVSLLRPHADFMAGRGVSLAAPDGTPAVDAEALARALNRPGPDTPHDLAHALSVVHELATAAGLYALLTAIPPAELGYDSQFGLEPSDVAVRAWAHDRERVERVHAEQSAARPRAFDLFQTDADPLPAFPPPTPEQLRPLEAVLGEVIGRRGRGPGTRVFACPGDHECLFLVRRPDPYRREAALQGAEPGGVLYRPLKYDVVGYEPGTGTLRVHASRKSDVAAYRQQFGKHLFGDIEFFGARGRYTLDPLMAGDPACLAHTDVPGVRTVALTELELAWGGPLAGSVVYRAKDVLADLARRGERPAAGATPVRATFAVGFKGERAGAVRSVTLVPPNVAQYCRDDDGPKVDAWLQARGFVRPRGRGAGHGHAHAVLQGR